MPERLRAVGLCFEFRKSGERGRTVAASRKDEGLMQSRQRRETGVGASGKRHEVGPAVFGELAANRPDRRAQIDILPAHAHNLVAPLRGQQQKLHQNTKGMTNRLCRPPDRPKLVIREDPLACFGLCWLLDRAAGRALDKAALDAPIEALADSGKSVVSPAGRAALDNSVEHIQDVFTPDVADIPALPLANEIVLEDASRLLARTLAIALRAVHAHELVDDAAKKVGGREFLFRLPGVDPPRHLIECLFGELTRLSEPKHGVAPQGETLWQASEPVEQDERLRSRGRHADTEAGKLRVPHLHAFLPAFELAQEQVGERLFDRLFQNPLVLKRFFG